MATRSQMIERRIREGILEGEFAAGARRHELELARQLGVSRTPVRAALSVLASEGLLHYTPNSGFTVQVFTSQDIVKIYELRATLSGLAARLATQNGIGEEGLDQLRALVRTGRELLEDGIWTPEVFRVWEQTNESFHCRIDEAAQNPYVLAAVQRTRDIPVLREIRYRWIDPETLAVNQSSHEAILDALRRGQQRRAEDLTAEHVYQNGQRIVRQWREIERRNGAEARGGDEAAAEETPARSAAG